MMQPLHVNHGSPAPETHDFRSYAIDHVLPWSLLVVASVMLVFYLTVAYYPLLNSDSVMKIMLGQEMATQLSLVPHGWAYENDIPIVFPSLIAAFFGLFSGPSYAMQAGVDIVAAFALLYAAYAASRAVGISGPLRLLAPTILASGISEDVSEFVFGQSAYSAPMFVMFVIAGCGARFLASSDAGSNEGPRRFDVFAIAIIIAAGVAGGPRGLVTYALPTLCALTINYLFVRRRPNDGERRTRTLLAATLAASLFGGAIFLLLLLRVNYHSGSIPNSLVDGLHIARNIQTSAKNWLVLFGALPVPGIPLNWVTLIPYASHFLIAVITFLLPLSLLARIWRVENSALRFLVLLHASLLGSLGSVLLLTRILDHQPDGVPRYFSPLLPTAFLICVLSLQSVVERRRNMAIRVVWACVLAFLMFSPRLLVAPAFANWTTPSAGLAANPRTQVIAALENAKLTHGYASYWHANAITVLSSGRVTTLPILVDGGGMPQRQHFMTADRWFEQAPVEDRFFFLLDPIDSKQINRAGLESTLGSPAESFSVGPFEVLVFPSKLNERLGFAAPKESWAIPKVPATCAATYEALDDHMELAPHEFGNLKVRATNHSSLTWSRNWSPRFGPGVRILDTKGMQIAELRAPLPHEVTPGESITLDIPMRAPDAGDYVVKFSFVVEGYAWCGNLGTGWASIPLKVKP